MNRCKIGIENGIKCLVDDNNVAYITDTITLLQSLDLKHPVDQYVLSVCQSFHQSHHHRVKTLLYMIQALVKAASILKEQGVPLSYIRRHMCEGIDICSEHADAIKLPIQLELNDGKEVRKPVILQKNDNLESKQPKNLHLDHRNTTFESQQPIINLEMREKTTKYHNNDFNDEEDDDDDISWYFQSDDLSGGKTDDSLPTKFKTLSINHMKIDSEDDVTITSLRQNSDTDSDFDNCFEGIPTYSKVIDGTSTKHTSSNSRESSRLSNITDSAKEHLTENGKYSTSAEMAGDKGKRIDVASSTLNTEALFDQNIGDISETVVKGDFVSDEDKKQNLTDLIANRLKHKKLTMSKTVLNRSRYFKTVTSTVEELNQGNSSEAAELNEMESEGKRNISLAERDMHDDSEFVIEEVSSTVEEINQEKTFEASELNEIESVRERKISLAERNREKGNSEFIDRTMGKDTMGEDPKIKKHGSEESSDSLVSNGQESNDSLLSSGQELSDSLLSNREKSSDSLWSNGNHNLRTAEELQNVLNQKLMKASKQRMSNVLLNSRHYKTMDDCVLGGTASESNCDSEENEILSHDAEFPDEEGFSSRDSNDKIEMKSPVTTGDKYEDCNDRIEKRFGESISLSESVHGLCRGKKIVAELILEAVRHQNEDAGHSRIQFDANRVICLSLSGSHLKPPTLIQGLTVSVPVHVMSVIHQRQSEKFRCVLVNGDLRMSYHHKGYKDTLTATTVYNPGEYTDRQTAEGAWLDQLIDTHTQVPYDVLLCKGGIDDRARSLLESQRIICIEGVSYRSLLSLAVSHHVTMVTYMEEISEDHILRDITLTPLYNNWSLSSSPNHPVIIKSSKKILQTAIYNHPCEMGRAKFETDFLRALYVVQSSIQNGYVIPGEGRTEQSCYQKLVQESVACMQTDSYRSVVLQQLAEVMMTFFNTVQNNAKAIQNSIAGFHDNSKISRDLTKDGKCSIKCQDEKENNTMQVLTEQDSDKQFTHSFSNDKNTLYNGKFSYPSTSDDVYIDNQDASVSECKGQGHHLDNVSSKTAAWRTAFETMTTIMSTDVHIITGNDKSERKMETLFANKVIL